MSKDIEKIYSLPGISDLDKEAKQALIDFIRQSQSNSKGNIEDIWHQDENAISFWLLLINGIDSKKESAIAKELLFWREFLVGDDAQLRCIQTSDRIISKFCSSHFKIANPPVLIFANDPYFNNFIKIESELLFELSKEENKLRNFVSKIHTEIFRGKSLKEINKSFGSEKFWKGLRMIYKEVKSFVTVSIKADVNE